MAEVLYEWPAAAAFGRRVPKEKLYAHGSVSSEVRERFVAEVRNVEWAFKLAESTINLPGSAEVPELQVFRVSAKGEDVAERVLAAIDRAVISPIIFEIFRDDGVVRMVATAKKSGSYHSTLWLPHTHPRHALPTAINLSALHIALIEPLLPVSVRAGESPAEVAARLQDVARLEREIAAAEHRLRNEPQLKRKLELRRSLKALKAELESRR